MPTFIEFNSDSIQVNDREPLGDELEPGVWVWLNPASQQPWLGHHGVVLVPEKKWSSSQIWTSPSTGVQVVEVHGALRDPPAENALTIEFSWKKA